METFHLDWAVTLNSSSVLNTSLLLKENSKFSNHLHILAMYYFPLPPPNFPEGQLFMKKKQRAGGRGHLATGCTSAEKGWKKCLMSWSDSLGISFRHAFSRLVQKQWSVCWQWACSPSEVLHSLWKSHNQLTFQQSCQPSARCGSAELPRHTEHRLWQYNLAANPRHGGLEILINLNH